MEHSKNMGKLACICGNILSDTCGSGGEAFEENQMNENEFYLAGEGRSILECEECGALAIEYPIESSYVKYYLPENGKFNGLFRK